MTPQEAFGEISKGNEEAGAFCVAFFEAVHAVDDLVDRDKPDRESWSVLAILRAFHVFGFNPFFAANRDFLWPIIHTSVLTYLSSNDLLTREDVRSKFIGEVLKSQYQDVFFAVAFLVGGVEHQLACQKKFRDYCFG